MATSIIMPKLGLTMTEGTISRWCKKEGDNIKKGDVLFEVTTDKMTNEVEADTDGVLRKIIVNEGEIAPCKETVAVVGVEDEDITALLPGDTGTVRSEAVDTSVVEKEEKVHAAAVENGYVKASPAAKKLARDNNVALDEVTGTGPSGRIVIKDVQAFVEEHSRKKKISPVAARAAEEYGVNISEINKDGRIMKQDVLDTYASRVQNNESQKVSRVVMTSMRKVISERMSDSWHTSPMVGYNLKVDMQKLEEMRNLLKDSFAKQGVKLSYNHIMIKVCAKALMEFPYLNSSVEGNEIVLHDYVNAGLAVAVENGLLVPNIKNAHAKSLLEIAVECEAIVERTRNNKIVPDDIQNGTFTITNLGMFGIETFTPIINQPEVAILGMGAMSEQPVIANGLVVVKKLINLCLTADHRVVDGALAARFLARIKVLMENPFLLLV